MKQKLILAVLLLMAMLDVRAQTPYKLDEFSFILPSRQFDEDAFGFTRDFLLGNDIENPTPFTNARPVMVDAGTEDERTEQYVTEAIRFNDIMSLKDRIVPAGTEQDNQFFAAVRLYYGLNGNKLVLIFLPMNAIQTNPAVLQFELKYGDLIDGAQKPNEKEMYYWSDGSWQHETFNAGSNILKWVRNYRSSIWFRKLGGDGGFIKNPADFQGVKGIAFSFQEVKFLKDNYERISGETNPMIYITSLSSTFRVRRDYRLKHKLAFSVYPPGTSNKQLPYVADLGSLCPVNCTSLKVSNGSFNIILK